VTIRAKRPESGRGLSRKCKFQPAFCGSTTVVRPCRKHPANCRPARPHPLPSRLVTTAKTAKHLGVDVRGRRNPTEPVLGGDRVLSTRAVGGQSLSLLGDEGRDESAPNGARRQLFQGSPQAIRQRSRRKPVKNGCARRASRITGNLHGRSCRTDTAKRTSKRTST